jgi:DNA-binding transcriptional ArsR family regulator
MKHAALTISTNPVFEMLVSLNRIADSDQMESNYYENAGYTPHPRMAEIIEEIKTGLSMFYRQEITFFFGKPVCSLLWSLVIAEDIRDISQLAARFSALSDREALRHLLMDVLEAVCQQEGDLCQDESAMAMMLADLPALEQRMSDCPNLSAADQEKAREILRYPADAKQRLARLLDRYAQLFAAYVDELEALDLAEAEKSRPVLLADAEAFISSYLKINVNILEPARQIDMVPNAFSEILTFVLQPDKDRFVLVYGTFISKKRSREKRSEERKQFFKVLSEEKRVDIIKSLATRPAIGTDLAKQIGLTSATASYHLTMLLGIGLVEYERIGQKLHYILNKEMLKDLFDKAYRDLINQ